ncbi:hypothetical protein GLW08_18095 [Pontibacillus yanchengensis]|uniref:DUF4083 domain-containing protein n=3 Tax=Pontibacillus yanchengensis TaxID=462910 RepID=A0A6I5A3Z3_9BACI|nr:hypothetical protein [Pontibacillus yanchengensis]MYL55238.1 hypothetical protein [Pontibacillus yanchengensis]
MAVFGIVNMLFYLAIIGFVIYVILKMLSHMEERNTYLKEIRNELRKSNENEKVNKDEHEM